MEKRKYRSAGNFKLRKADIEKCTGTSVTVPGQSYTVGELLKKHIQGNMPNIGKEGTYEEDPDIDNPDPTQKPDFDLSDVTVLQKEIQEKITLNDKLKAEKVKKDLKIKEEKAELLLREKIKIEEAEKRKNVAKNAEEVKD